MKKIILLLIIFTMSITHLFAYKFPLKNPYTATIIGSSTLMTPGVSEEIPRKIYELKIKEKVLDVFWYAKNFKFSLVSQKKEAPLIFLLAGTGSDYNSIRVKYMERILYDAGYNVISISSPMSSQFLISASERSAPGLLMEDGKDIYKVMKLAYEKVKNKIKVTDFYLLGYSLGATNSAIVSYIDDTENFFNFKRVFMINPAVNLYESSKKLDNFLDNLTGKNSRKIELLIESVLNRMKANMKNEYTNIDEETIYKLVGSDFLSQEEKKAFIGLAFRLSSVDLNFISDVLTKSYIYTEKSQKLKKNISLSENFRKVDFSNFQDYVEKIGYPYYKKYYPEFTMEDLKEKANLKVIDDYLRHSKNIVAVTNLDELILSEDDIEYLKDTFKDRIILYPTGGHCGNMFYYENINIMLNFLKNGVLKYED